MSMQEKPALPELDRLPPRVLEAEAAAPETAAARQLARAQRDAAVRGVSSIEAMRAAVQRATSVLPTISAVPRHGVLDAAQFRALAAQGQPFLMTGLVSRWPLCQLTPQVLRDQYSQMPVRARVGDYINTAFAPDRAMADMRMGEYLDLIAAGDYALPPYLGNLELRELNRLCHWPVYFDKMGPPRFWIGPAGTITPLHADYDDNIFAQIWASKRIRRAPPHHGPLLSPKPANEILIGSPVDAEAPDYQRYPLARQATLIECRVEAGEMLYIPAGWYHQVHALSFSLSSNRWARAMPLVLSQDDQGVRA